MPDGFYEISNRDNSAFLSFLTLTSHVRGREMRTCVWLLKPASLHSHSALSKQPGCQGHGLDKKITKFKAAETQLTLEKVSHYKKSTRFKAGNNTNPLCGFFFLNQGYVSVDRINTLNKLGRY